MATPRFGVHLHPVHRPDHDPTLQLEQGVTLAEHADRLGLREMWWGEHQRSSWRLVADPMLMVARAAATTHRIRLGAVSTVALRHPANLLDSALQLDHLTRGRLLLGLSADVVPDDVTTAGLTVAEAQLEIREGVDAFTRLLRDRAPVSMTARHASWRLRGATPPLRPYAEHLDARVVSLGSAPGPELAGRFDHGLVTTACSAPVGLGRENRMADAWQRASTAAERHGTALTRERWAVISPIHVAESEIEARRQVRDGIRRWAGHSPGSLPTGVPQDADADTLVDALHAGGHGVVGTPEMAVDHIGRVLDLSGGVGTVLVEVAGWAPFDRTLASLELFARAVVPQLTGAARSRLVTSGAAPRAARAGRRAAPSSPLSSVPTPARGVTRVHHDAGTRPAAERPRRRGRHALDPSPE